MSKFSAGSQNVLDIKKKAHSQKAASTHMMPLFPERRMRLKTRRLRKRMLGAGAAVFTFVLLGIAVSASTHLDQLAIHSIVVNGTSAIPNGAVIAAVADSLHDPSFSVIARKNMFVYPKGDIITSLESQFPRIDTVTVGRPSLLSDEIVADVSERVPFALWCETKCYLMDDHGFIFAEAATTTMSYVFHGGLAEGEIIGQTFLRGRLPSTMALLGSLKDAGFEARDVTVMSDHDFSFLLQNGPIVYASFDMTSLDIVKNLTTTMQSDAVKGRPLEYIDLRFGNRVYFK